MGILKLLAVAFYLGKLLLVVPTQGLLEQTLNALFLQREHRGHAVIDRPLTVPDGASS